MSPTEPTLSASAFRRHLAMAAVIFGVILAPALAAPKPDDSDASTDRQSKPGDRIKSQPAPKGNSSDTSGDHRPALGNRTIRSQPVLKADGSDASGDQQSRFGQRLRSQRLLQADTPASTSDQQPRFSERIKSQPILKPQGSDPAVGDRLRRLALSSGRQQGSSSAGSDSQQTDSSQGAKSQQTDSGRTSKTAQTPPPPPPPKPVPSPNRIVNPDFGGLLKGGSKTQDEAGGTSGDRSSLPDIRRRILGRSNSTSGSGANTAGSADAAIPPKVVLPPPGSTTPANVDTGQLPKRVLLPPGSDKPTNVDTGQLPKRVLLPPGSDKPANVDTGQLPKRVLLPPGSDKPANVDTGQLPKTVLPPAKSRLPAGADTGLLPKNVLPGSKARQDTPPLLTPHGTLPKSFDEAKSRGAGKAGAAGQVESGLLDKRELRNRADLRFTERYKAGHFEQLTKGDVAQKIKLDEQLRLLQQGDVARRMELHKHVTNITNVTNVIDAHHPFIGYHGRVSPAYVSSCFRFEWYGLPYFSVACWYPHWNPWVDWCWHYHCPVIWDPRPIWCRPVIYDPCPYWIWWEVPVWTPLPVVTCGTWVDVEPTPAPSRLDLQLLAVRFVDPGHPEEKLGPRYRVWFRNNSDQAISQPFNVVLLASGEAKLAEALPQAGVRVTSIEAADTQSVDVRLPVEVYTMGRDPKGDPAPFTTLHALVDANREVPETFRANNGVRLARADVLPVDPAAFEAEPSRAPAGAEVLLAGEGFGPGPGQVLVHVGGLELEGEILGWYDLGARFTLPSLPLTGPTKAELIVIRADGAAANPVQITVTPPENPGPKIVAPALPQ